MCASGVCVRVLGGVCVLGVWVCVRERERERGGARREREKRPTVSRKGGVVEFHPTPTAVHHRSRSEHQQQVGAATLEAP